MCLDVACEDAYKLFRCRDTLISIKTEIHEEKFSDLVFVICERNF